MKESMQELPFANTHNYQYTPKPKLTARNSVSILCWKAGTRAFEPPFATSLCVHWLGDTAGEFEGRKARYSEVLRYGMVTL